MGDPARVVRPLRYPGRSHCYPACLYGLHLVQQARQLVEVTLGGAGKTRPGDETQTGQRHWMGFLQNSHEQRVDIDGELLPRGARKVETLATSVAIPGKPAVVLWKKPTVPSLSNTNTWDGICPTDSAWMGLVETKCKGPRSTQQCLSGTPPAQEPRMNEWSLNQRRFNTEPSRRKDFCGHDRRAR
ncbi:hypothetical protein NPIL_57371 [Nephila pilipes]|uniref:Uncharacterized protein n=1 Tax=Nephila pilipes TaxID=299642 RepID=A0A8X6QE28_NEPPI|nr:hypothetical protein NPIL_57371 [Nephila pilipes]